LGQTKDQKPIFSYSAFAKDLRGESYGVSDVVRRRFSDPAWHLKKLVQISAMLKSQHVNEPKPETYEFAQDEEGEVAVEVEELKKMRKEGLYSFQKNYVSMEDIRMRREELHAQDLDLMA